MSGRECIDTSVLNVPNLGAGRGGGGGLRQCEENQGVTMLYVGLVRP